MVVPDYVSLSDQNSAGLLLSLAVAICFREHINKIENRHMAYSMWVALLFYLVGCVTGTITFQQMSVETSLDGVQLIFDWQRLGSTAFDIMFASLSYHTTYRALILMLPTKQYWLWIPSLAISAIEFAIFINLYFGLIFSLIIKASTLFYKDMKDNFGTMPNPAVQKLSIALLVYIVTVDTLFFIASQARIVAVMGQINEVKPSVVNYLDIVLRCLLYSVSLTLFFLTTGGFLVSTQGEEQQRSLSPPLFVLVFIIVAPGVMCVVLLTDADRVRKLVSAMQGRPASAKSSFDKNSVSDAARASKRASAVH
ncbi:hypothetical protein DFJ73DRAFT_819235 [Zopfochytrium polystomum]|nr:hypothetical protein DFJ73DRAFT_819235 [Zopfochytrium polystomum]